MTTASSLTASPPAPTETVPLTETEAAVLPSPDDISQRLKRTEKRELGEEEQLAGLAKGLVELLYTFPNQERRFDFANPTLQKQLTDLAERSKTSLPEATAHWPDVVKDLEQLCTDQPDLLKGFPKEKQTGYREAEKEVLTALVSLMLRGTLTGELLKLVVDGGITYQTQKVATDQHSDIDNVGHFVTKDHDGKARIYLYPRAFKTSPRGPDGQPTQEEIATEPLIAHELAHGLLRYDNLLLPWNDIRMLIKDPATAKVTAGLFGIERTLLQEMFLRPDQAAPWQPRYVSQLLGKLSHNPGDEALRKQIVEEYYAEALQMYLRSSGRPADYLHKRLEESQFYTDFRQNQAKTPKNQPLDPQLSQLFKDWSNQLATTDLHQPAALTQLVSQVDQFVTQTLTDSRFDNDKKQHFKNLLLEAAVMHSRFQALRGRDKLQKVAAVIAGKQASVWGDDFFGGYSTDRLGSGSWGDGDKQPGFWHIIIQALAELPTLIRG